MKRQFLIACAFIFAVTTGVLQADSNPTMSRVYGAQFTPQVADTQSAATIGTLDTTFDGDGSLSVNGALSGGQAVGIQTLPNGNFITVLSLSGSASVAAQYNAEGTIASTAVYGTSGIVTLGTIAATVTPRATMLDTQGRLLVAGGAASGTAGWIVRVSTDGDTVTTFTTGTAWSNVGGLAQQSLTTNAGKIIAAGYNNANAQIGRYNLDGTIDTTFGGGDGLVAFDGTGVLPTATTGLYSVVVDASDNIYVAFIASATANGFTGGNAYIARFTEAGALDTTWNTTGFAALSALNSATSGLYVAQNANGNFMVGAQVTPNVIVTGVTSAGAAIGGFTTFNTSAINGDTYTINQLVTTSDNSIFILGSDTTSINMAVIRLVGGTGALDTAFNTTGYNLFNIAGGTITASSLQAAAIAVDGQIYAAGYQTVNTPATTPYVSRLNNTQYVSAVSQFPEAELQGILDQTFGTPSQQTNVGIVTPFNGLYGSSMMQRPQSMVEVTTTSGAAAGVPPVGDILVGMNGFTNTSASSNMMLGWLTSAGVADTSVNTTGFLTLANSLTNEYLTSILQGPSGLVYVAGYSSATVDGASTGALLRAYSTASTTTWTSGVAAWSVAQSTAGYQATAVGYQAADTRTLLFVAESATVGHITGYNSSGALDLTFGDGGSGTIAATSYSLNMGPCYSALVKDGDNLVIAYKDSSDNTVRAVEFTPDGSALNTAFGTSGVSAALFAGVTNIAANNIRIAFNSNGDIVVAAVNGAGTSLLFTLLDAETGAVDAGFGTAGVLTVAITGSTSLLLKQIVGVSDGKTLATFYDNATDDTMYLTRITLLGALDSATFNTQGSQPGVLNIQIGDEVTNYNARVATAALVQSTAGANQGNIVMAGYESVTANDVTPMVMRPYGTLATTEIPSYPLTDTGVPGTLDVAYNLNALLGTGAGKVIFAYPGGNTYQGKILVGFDNGTTSKVARIDITTNTLDTTFGTSGIYTILTNLTGITSLSIDAQNNVLVGGTTGGGTAWAQQLSPVGASPVSFTLPATITAVNSIYQQKSGRYIIAASGVHDNPVDATAIGVLVAFQDKVVSPATTLVVDPTFNPLGTGAVLPGECNVGTTSGLYTMAINTNDTIVVAYANATPKVVVMAFTANGSGYVSGFNGGVPITTTLTPDSSATIRLNIDSTGRVIVGTSSSNTLIVSRYSSAGVLDTAGFGTAGIATLSDVGAAGVTLTSLMATSSNQTVLVGYNTDATLKLFASRLDSAGVEDTTWNSGASLTYDTNSATRLNSSTITISGLIASIGQQATGTAGDPILTYVFGDNYVTQASQNPLEAAAGTLDSTIPGNVSGALALSGLVTGVPQKIYMYTPTVANGQMLIASKVDSTATVYVTLLNADLSLGTFGTSGVKSFTPNSGLSPATVTITDMYVATNNSGVIYLTGYTTTAGNVSTMWAEQITSDGATATAVTPVSTLITSVAGVPASGGIRQSSNSRVLISGYDGSFGKVVAYNSAMNVIDTSFGNGSGTGYYTTVTANPIVAMTTDSSDRIYIAYKVSNSVIYIQRLLENGTAVDTSFGIDQGGGVYAATLTGTTLSANQIKLVIDLTNSQVIVAAQDGTGAANIIQLKRFDFDGVATAAQLSTITIGGAVLNLSDLFIDNDSTGAAYPNIYVVGYTAAGNSVVARVATTSTTYALDATYGSAGIANLTIGSSTMSVVTAAGLDPDRRVYLVGSNGATAGYMGRFFGDYYWTQASYAMLQGVVGAIDTTLSPNFTGGINLAAQTGWSSLDNGYKARAIIENPNGDGSSFIAFGNDTNLIVGKVNADMVPMTFGTATLTVALAMATVNNITVDAAGSIIVVGTNAGAQKVVSFTSAGVLQATFDAAPVASTVGTVVGQQKSGRYIVGGYTGSFGIVSAYKNPSAITAVALAVDPTFGAAALSGYYVTAVASQIDDLVIDSNDYIYITYRNAGTVNVAKLTPEGALVTSANTPAGQVWSTNPVTATGITSASQPAHIAINGAGNILIGASTSTPDVKVALINGAAGTVSVSGFAVYATSTPVLTKLVGSVSTQNEFYGSIYNSAPAAIVFAVTAAGALDNGFGTSGVTSTVVQSPVQVNGLSIQVDGKVVMVGYTAGPDPILLRFYGYPYMSQYAQAPNLIAAGILDTTLWPTTGALNLDGYTPVSTTITTLNGSKISRIYEYSNGKALLVFSNTNAGADTVVARVNKDLTLDTSFNLTGFVTIAAKNNASSLFVDSDSNIYVAGGTTTSWIRVYNNAGTLQPGWESATALTAGAYQVGIQSNDRTILAGKNTNGTLYGYNTSGVLDATFGTSGVVNMGTTDAITDFTVDSSNTIITAKITSGSTVLQRVSASGLTVTALTAANAAPITTANGNVKVVLDTAGSIVVASATTAGFAIARYNNDSTGTTNGAQVTFAVGGTSTSVLGNIYATSDGKITLVGYETTGNKVVVARLISSPSGVSNANIVLDIATFNSAATTGVAGIMETVINSAAFLALDGIICADDRIMIAGTQASDPYLARVFGDDYVTYVSQGQTQGVAGTINPTFGTAGTFDDSTLNALLSGAQGKAIFPLSNGGYYQAFDLANTAASSILIKTLANGALDTTYNTGGANPGIAGTDTGTYAPLGVNALLQDGASNVLLVGTTGGAGWLRRYDSTGVKDTAFGTAGAVVAGTVATVAVEQTLGRYVVAGANGSGGALFAYQSLSPNGTPGTVDTTFNSTGAGATTGGTTPGIFLTNTTNTVHALIADQYDRLIYAVLNNGNNAVDLYRLTASGQYDITFGTAGKVTAAITAASNAPSSVRLGLDDAGNIIVAANSSTANTFSVRAFDNGVSTTAGANGAAVYAQLDVTTTLTGPSVTALQTSSDGYTLILGTQSGTGAAWIARITAGGALDTTGFNPGGVGGIAGIFQYTGSGNTAPAHVYNALAVNADGTLGMLGYETSTGPVYTPTLVSVYNDPYTAQESQSPNSKAVGTNDKTLGVSTTSYANNGMTFYGVSGNAASGQVARAVALYDDNNIVVAIDGNSAAGSGTSEVMINMFNNDGILNPSFSTAGTATALSTYQNQYVNDMITFTTVAGVTKAILAGYVYNSALPAANQYSSLLLQYILTPGSNALDTANFGGFNGSPVGVALGDGKQLFTVGQQSIGRIIAAGLSQDDLGLLLGYTSAGKLDTSFGNDGYQSTNTGTTGIYTQAIDTQNRVVIAYNNGSNSVAVARFLADGSALDSGFATPTPLIATISGNSNMKVAVDSSNNVVVAAVTNGGNEIKFKKYAAAGGAATQEADIPYSSLGGSSSALYVLGRLLVDTSGKVILVAYDSFGQLTLVMRLTSALALDTTFNGTGYITYTSAGGTISQVAKDAMIHPDGRIIVVGSEL